MLAEHEKYQVNDRLDALHQRAHRQRHFSTERQAEPRLGETVAVIGLGALGLLFLIALLGYHGLRTALYAPDAYRRYLAVNPDALGVRLLLAERLETQVDILNPFNAVTYSPKEVDADLVNSMGPAAAIAVGLAGCAAYALFGPGEARRQGTPPESG